MLPKSKLKTAKQKQWIQCKKKQTKYHHQFVNYFTSHSSLMTQVRPLKKTRPNIYVNRLYFLLLFFSSQRNFIAGIFSAVLYSHRLKASKFLRKWCQFHSLRTVQHKDVFLFPLKLSRPAYLVNTNTHRHHS